MTGSDRSLCDGKCRKSNHKCIIDPVTESPICKCLEVSKEVLLIKSHHHKNWSKGYEDIDNPHGDQQNCQCISDWRNLERKYYSGICESCPKSFTLKEWSFKKSGSGKAFVREAIKENCIFWELIETIYDGAH